MADSRLIDDYLDQLLDALRVDGAQSRRILTETEDHLREAVLANVAAGMDEVRATEFAIERFGEPRQIAARFNAAAAAALPLRSWLFRLYLWMALLAGVGVLAIGIGGELAAGAGLVFGKSVVAGDQPGTTYTPQRCAQFQSFYPEASSCSVAAVDHHFSEKWLIADVAVVAGVVVVASHLWLRSRYATTERGRSFPRRAFHVLGAAGAGAGGVALTGFGGLSIALQPHSGGGFFVAEGLVALAACAAFLPAGWRDLRAMATEYGA